MNLTSFPIMEKLETIESFLISGDYSFDKHELYNGSSFGLLVRDHIETEEMDYRERTLEEMVGGPDVEMYLHDRHGGQGAIVGLLIESILMPVICCLGILGNGLNILVLTRQRIRRSVRTPDQAVHVGLVFLAVSDMIVCLLNLPRAFTPDDRLLFKHYTVACFYQLYSTGLITTFQLISTWLIVITAALRYVVIGHPLLSRGPPSHANGYIVVAVIYIFCTIVNIPSFYLFRANTHRVNSTDLLLIDIGPMDHRTGEGFAFAWCKAALTIFIPGILLGFFNIRLIQALKVSDRLRYQSSDSSINSIKLRGPIRYKRSTNRLNLTLVAVIVMFVCLDFPAEFLDLFTHLNPFKMVFDNEAVISARRMTNALQLTNFALNFFLYCTLHHQFRKALADWCCRRLNLHFNRMVGRVNENGNDVGCGNHPVAPIKPRLPEPIQLQQLKTASSCSRSCST